MSASVDRRRPALRAWERSVLCAIVFVRVVGLVRVEAASALPGIPRRPLHEIELRLDLKAAQQLRQQPRTYVPATLTLDGQSVSGVGVHLKGQVGTFQPLDAQPSLTIDLARFGGTSVFRGTTKFHLNNRAEDPSALCEWLGAEVFRHNGHPAPVVAHAHVRLNGRRLGLYVLKEGFTDAFLQEAGLSRLGTLAEPPPGGDIDQAMVPKAGHGTATNDPEPLARAALATATSASPEQRWQRLGEVLDRTAFIDFIALEVLLSHHDGYSLNRNNYRIYFAPEPQNTRWLPAGMDQLFSLPEARWNPQMAGQVARAILETPEGTELYAERIRSLHREVLQPKLLEAQLEDQLERLKSYLTWKESHQMSRELRGLKERIRRRAAALEQQFIQADSPPLRFVDGRASLSGWRQTGAGADGEPSASRNPSAPLELTATQNALSEWRTRVQLPHGSYRFVGRIRVEGVRALTVGQPGGARLRIAGSSQRSEARLGTSDWKEVAVEFIVEPTATPRVEVELICELRAAEGRAWFDAASLRLEQGSQP